MEKVFRIFYSWQSTVEQNDNRFYIRNKIQHFISHSSYNLMLDEATRDTAGSPDIVSSIMGKIGVADIFICDLSIVKKDETDKSGMPNPNVMFELGVAVALLGWERIICVVNTYFGSIDLLPFDVNHHRCLPYEKNGTEIKKLDFSEPISVIISKYDEIITRFCQNDHIEHDKKIFETLMIPYSENELINSLDDCKTSRTYNNYYWKLWEYFMFFHRAPKNRFIFEELNEAYKTFAIAIDKMTTGFIALFNPIDYGWEKEDPDQNYTQDAEDEILRNQRYKMKEPEYPNLVSDEKNKEYYNSIDDNTAKINYHCNNVLNCFIAFRDAIKKRLFI